MLTVIIGVVALAGGFAGGFLYRKKVSEKEISSAEEEGRRIVNEAIRNAESKKKEALLEAKEEILKSRTDYEKEEKSRRADLQRQENRLQQKEENLDRKLETIEKKEESLAQKHAAMEKEQEEIRTIKQSQTAMLEKISGFTADEAKEYLIQQVESEVTHETALKIKEVESRMKEECETRAREVVAQA
ncbi:Rnase Y domain-containing protein, partial [Dysosmobacter sp.]